MERLFDRGSRAVLLFAFLLSLVLCSGGRAQTPCYNSGSTPVAATITAAPVNLDCPGAQWAGAGWPVWHLFTPAHRAPAPHLGYNPGDAVAKPRWIVAYRCTGLLLLPVLPYRVTTMGYVIDRSEHACDPVNP